MIEDESRRANGEYVLYEDGPTAWWCGAIALIVGCALSACDQLDDKKAFLALVRDVLGTQVVEEGTSGHHPACSDHSWAGCERQGRRPVVGGSSCVPT